MVAKLHIYVNIYRMVTGENDDIYIYIELYRYKPWILGKIVGFVLFNIAMGNGPFIDGLPIKNGDFPWLC